jgi:hypothetical protein
MGLHIKKEAKEEMDTDIILETATVDPKFYAFLKKGGHCCMG